MDRIPHIGEIFALASPVSWAIAIILFRKSGEKVGAPALNLFKNAFGLLLFAVTLAITNGPSLSAISARDCALLLVSGAIGIGISDVLFFMTLNRVGAALEAIITTAYSPSIILLSYFFLHERMAPLQIVGVLLILSAVLSVGTMRGGSSEIHPRTLASGVVYGLLGTATQAVAIVMIKPMLESSPIVWANTWRLMGGLAMSVLLFPLVPRRREALGSLRNLHAWRVMVPATIAGTYVSLLFWLGGMKYTEASIAAALNQTSTLWTFVLAAIVLREPVTWRRIVGLALGVAGAALVTFG
jgi:drug/metabolite transporter (DMT)-like permease